MAGKHIFLPEAEQDLAAAYDWYDEQQPGLGEEFLRCVDARVLSILRNPELYPPAFETFRRALVRRFPFAIFYAYEREQVVIHSVFHCSQNPEKWRRRLRGD